MSLSSEKWSATLLVEVLVNKGLRDVIISPGSRNAPLTIAFNQKQEVNKKVIFDERSAGFVALGMAQQLRRPVAVLCTSGSALLNYAPAVVEAFYQKIPILILSADRPKEWIDQGDGQTIRQYNVFANYIKKSFEIPSIQNESKDLVRYVERVGYESFDCCLYPEFGPVHINLPYKEPLYKKAENNFQTNLIQTALVSKKLSQQTVEELNHIWEREPRRLILCGMLNPSKRIEELLQKISANGSVILTETTSNVFGQPFVNSIDAWLATIPEENVLDYVPDLLITIGGSIVSKRIKAFLRSYKPQHHWHVSVSDFYLDTFQSLSLNIPLYPESFLEEISCFKSSGEENGYTAKVDELYRKGRKAHELFMNSAPYSDLSVFGVILSNLPKNSQLQLGNSTSVRYAQLFDQPPTLINFSNRGTSGIDGCVSTALGASLVVEQWVTLIVGDVSFFYDSNGLWNKYLPSNFRIIILNNSGGNIFRIIDGPSSTGLLEEYFECTHNTNAKDLAKAYNIGYCCASNFIELKEELGNFYNPEEGSKILEVFTPSKENPKVLKDYFSFLKEHTSS